MRELLLRIFAFIAILCMLCAALWLSRYQIHHVSTATGPVTIRFNRWTGEAEYARWRDNSFSSWSKVY